MQKRTNNKDRAIKAFIACFLTIIGFIVAILLWRDDEYVMYYAKHGLILFFGQLIISLAHPFILPQWFVYLLWVFWIILWIITSVNALSGFRRRTMIITDLAEKIGL